MWVLLLTLVLGAMSSDRFPQLVWGPRPVCPDSAEFSDIQGVVLVEVDVDSTGRVSRAAVRESTLPPSLTARGVEAAARYVFAPFTPVRLGGRVFPQRLVIPFGLRGHSEALGNLANVNLDLTLPERPLSAGDTVETRTTVQTTNPGDLRIALDVPGRIVLTGAERLYEVLARHGGELVLGESGLQWRGTVEPTSPLALTRRFILTSCDLDSVVVTQESRRSGLTFVRAAQRTAVVLTCR